MNSTTPGTLISYWFSPGSCCISSCPTISLPVTTCPFNVNLSPFSQAFHSYRVFCLPPSAQQQIVKKTISFFHLTHCYPSAVHCLSAGACGWAGERGWAEADVSKLLASNLGRWAQIYHRKFVSLTNRTFPLSSVAQKAKQGSFCTAR